MSKQYELPLITRVPWIRPEFINSADLVHLVEIASPEKLLAASRLSIEEWSQVEVADKVFMMTFVPYEEDAPDNHLLKDGCETLGFYMLIPPNALMPFKALFACATMSKARLSHEQVKEWMDHHFQTPFVVTCPVFRDMEGRIWSVVNQRTPSIISLNGIAMRMVSLIASGCFVITNGLCVLIAIHRLHKVSASVVCKLLTEVEKDFPLLTHTIQDDMHNLYALHTNFQPSDIPISNIGRGCSIKVVKCIHRLTKDNSDPVDSSIFIQFITNTGKATYCTPATFMYPNACASFLELAWHRNWLPCCSSEDLDFEEDDDNGDPIRRPALMLFFCNIFQNESTWSWWLRRKDAIIHRLLDMSTGIPEYLRMVITALSTAESYICNASTNNDLIHFRLQQVWKALLQCIGVSYIMSWQRTSFIHKIVSRAMDINTSPFNECGSKSYIRFLTTHILPKAKLHQIYKVKVTLLRQEVTDLFFEKLQAGNITLVEVIKPVADVVAEQPQDTATVSKHRIFTCTSSWIELANAAAKFEEPISQIVAHYYKVVASRLLAIKNGFGLDRTKKPTISLDGTTTENDLFVVGNIMLEYLERNKELLYK